jgi:hypothetical protein
MKKHEIRTSSFSDYSFPVVHSCFITVRYEGIITELLGRDRSTSHSQLNPLKYRSGELFTDQITSCYLHNCLKLKTLTFSAEDILQKPDYLSTTVEALCSIPSFDILNNSCEIVMKIKMKELAANDESSSSDFQYGCRFTDNTQIVVVDDLSCDRDSYSLHHRSAFNHLQFRLMPHSKKVVESFTGYLTSVQDRSFSSLSIFLEKFLLQSQRSAVSYTQKSTLFLNQPTLLTAHEYTSDGIYLVNCLCRKSFLSLLTVSVEDFLKYEYGATYPSMIQEYFSGIIRYCLAQDYCVLVFKDFHLLKPFNSSKKSVGSSSEYATASFAYDERCLPHILSCLFSLLQQYSSSSYNDSTSTRNNDSAYHRIVIVGITTNEESLSKELSLLFPVKFDIGNQYKLNYNQQFQQVCALYGRDDLKVEDFRFGAPACGASTEKDLDSFKSSFRSIYSFLNTVYHKEEFRYSNVLDLLMVLGFTKSNEITAGFNDTGSRQLYLFSSSKFFGINQIIQKCEEIIYWPLRYRSYYETMGLLSSANSPGHILLYGPSGCGKSSIPSELASRFQYNLIYLEITKIIQSSVGESEKEILRIFQDAKKKSPCFIVIDNFTAIFGKSENDLDSDNSVDKTLISTLIHCFDDINDWNTYNRNLVVKQQKDLGEVQLSSHCNSILVIGITGEPWNIPPRLLSFGRFQERIFIGFLSDEYRRDMISHFSAELMEYFLKSTEISQTNVDGTILQSLMIATKEFSGADVKHLFKLTFRHLLLRKHEEDANQVFSLLLEVCGKMRPSVPQYLMAKLSSWKSV